jgi:hypothetical protein
MKLTQATLPNYFSLPDESRSNFLLGKNLMDFISRNSNRLLITIGDSWTWGADLTQEKTRELHHSRLSDDNYRLTNMFGGVLSEMLDADFLSLGESGAGNNTMYLKLLELSKILNDLEYDQIDIICVFTEVGREFDSQFDKSVDYYSWLKKHVSMPQDYDKFMSFVNSLISKNIIDLISKFNKNVKIKFGTNFVDPIGFELLGEHFLNKSWLEIWCEHKGISYPEKCYVVSPWVIEKFKKSILSICPELNESLFLEWAIDNGDKSLERVKICSRDNVNFGPLMHPLVAGHRLWAEYLRDNL